MPNHVDELMRCFLVYTPVVLSCSSVVWSSGKLSISTNAHLFFPFYPLAHTCTSKISNLNHWTYFLLEMGSLILCQISSTIIDILLISFAYYFFFVRIPSCSILWHLPLRLGKCGIPTGLWKWCQLLQAGTLQIKLGFLCLCVRHCTGLYLCCSFHKKIVKIKTPGVKNKHLGDKTVSFY